MSADTDLTTQTVRWTIAARGTLPQAELSVVLAPARAGGLRVHVVHIAVPGRGDLAATSSAFDDGAVVVDRAADGRVLGVEFLADRDLDELPEFARSIASEKGGDDRALLLAAHATGILNWGRIGFYANVALRRGPGTAKRHLDVLDARVSAVLAELRAPPPEARRWRTGSDAAQLAQT